MWGGQVEWDELYGQARASLVVVDRRLFPNLPPSIDRPTKPLSTPPLDLPGQAGAAGAQTPCCCCRAAPAPRRPRAGSTRAGGPAAGCCCSPGDAPWMGRPREGRDGRKALLSCLGWKEVGWQGCKSMVRTINTVGGCGRPSDLIGTASPRAERARPHQKFQPPPPAAGSTRPTRRAAAVIGLPHRPGAPRRGMEWAGAFAGASRLEWGRRRVRSECRHGKRDVSCLWPKSPREEGRRRRRRPNAPPPARSAPAPAGRTCVLIENGPIPSESPATARQR